MSLILETKGLTKHYGDFTAVDNVSISLEEGKIYGLLGRNGAGKTTIMHMITSQLFPSSGSLHVFGEEPYENNNVLSRISFVKESQKYPDSYQVKDALDVAEMFHPNWDRDYAYSLIEDFQLPLKRRIKKLSRGMLSSVGIIIGLASRAPLTIFDEPYLGLDAVARNLFYNRLLEDFTEHPRTVVLSTHLIDEVSQMLEHVFLIDQGRIILNEDAEQLRGRAFSIAGRASVLDDFIHGRQVLSRDSLGALATATVMGSISTSDRKLAADQGLELTPVSLQQLIIHLTQENKTAPKGAASK
ncbi:ABC transporter ATP-binding protein [Paenibacillus mesotrionivorans]|jgi:ABC-2 type transport system ATP-binding protein|uniref:ABC transporter ATP-binding protein n=1 Tax=Paenibacillus mesotrionivorans TaxID=3160968 RepID=A0ACC7P6G7_9BACL